MEARLYKVAERYIIYREKRRELRSQNDAFLDIAGVTEGYLDNIDWRVSENSNMVHSYQGLILHMAGSVQARYMLEKYPEEVRMAIPTGTFTSTTFPSVWLAIVRDGVCVTFCWKDSICATDAPPRPPNTLTRPADRSSISSAHSRTSGREHRPSTISTPTLPPFVRHDGLDYTNVKQQIQKLLHNLNATSRWGGQSPFTNFTFDVVPPAHIAKEAIIIGGELQDSTYGEYAEEIGHDQQGLP